MPSSRAFLRRLARALSVIAATIALLLVLGLFLFHNRADSSQAEAEQYAVYSAYITPELTGESHDLGSRNGLVVILTVSDQFVNKGRIPRYRFLAATLPHARRDLGALSAGLILELLSANLSEEQLEPRFTIAARYKLASEIEVSDAKRFRERFPGSYGYLTFSRVAFNKDLTEAFFYTEHVCGLCGGGKYVYMRKVNGVWVVEGQSSTWVS